jgi:hypothetical protein
MRDNIKCPYCRGEPSYYIEHWEGLSIVFDAGSFDSYGTLDPGNPYRVSAVCADCGRVWRLRGVSQVTDIAGGAAALGDRTAEFSKKSKKI